MKKFIDGLEKWVQERDKRQDRYSVEFLAVKNDVSEAIKAGYSLKTIWEYLRKDQKITSSYETFRRHSRTQCNMALKAKTSQLGAGGFTHNRYPNKKDLF